MHCKQVYITTCISCPNKYVSEYTELNTYVSLYSVIVINPNLFMNNWKTVWGYNRRVMLNAIFGISKTRMPILSIEYIYFYPTNAYKVHKFFTVFWNVSRSTLSSKVFSYVIKNMRLIKIWHIYNNFRTVSCKQKFVTVPCYFPFSHYKGYSHQSDNKYSIY